MNKFQIIINYPSNSLTKEQTNNGKSVLNISMKKKPRTLKFIKRLTLKWFIPGTGNYISNQKQT